MMSTTRRALLRTAPALPLAGLATGPALAMADPDAELCALCREFERLEASHPEASGDEETFAICTATSAILDRISALPSHTAAGVRAKARVLAVVEDLGGLLRGSIPDPEWEDQRLVASLLRDLIHGQPVVSG